MRYKSFLSVAGIVGMLSGVASGAADGAEIGYDRDWEPYVTLRGGWLFGGKTRYGDHFYGNDTSRPPVAIHIYGDRRESFGSAWSGSVESGASFGDYVSVGLELGYFTAKAKHVFDNGEKRRYEIGGVVYFRDATHYALLNGKSQHLFAAVNVTLKKDVGERGFVYGGLGAGLARSDFGKFDWRYWENNIPPGGGHTDAVEKLDFKAKWRFLTQAFAGVGVYLNDNWALTAGYRLRYLPGDCKYTKKFAHDRAAWDWKIKQNVIHAAEIGLTYRF